MKDNKEKRTFKELWQDKRMHAVIVLGLWFLFFIIVFLILGIISLFTPNKEVNPPIKEETKEEVPANIVNLLENLKNSNYQFNYTVTNNESTITYNGNCENGEIIGYFENGEGIKKYTVKDGIYYQIIKDELIENTTLISDFDKPNLDINTIVEKIKEYEKNLEPLQEENVYTYDFLNDVGIYKIQVTVTDSLISKIGIQADTTYYELAFRNIV